MTGGGTATIDSGIPPVGISDDVIVGVGFVAGPAALLSIGQAPASVSLDPPSTVEVTLS